MRGFRGSGGNRSRARFDTPDTLRDSVSRDLPSDGSYGIPEGSFFLSGYLQKQRVQHRSGAEHHDFSREKMQATRRELLEERDGVKDLI